MTDYYCHLDAGFSDADGDPDGGGSGTVYQGPGGLQAAIRGTGLATALIAGDILYCKGAALLERLVWLTCGKDVSGWSIGDAVVDNNGGAEWDGVLVETSYLTNTDQILVQLSSYDEDDITLGSGINNTDSVDTTTLSAKDTKGIELEGNDGDDTDGNIQIIGCDDSWVPRKIFEDLAVLNGGGMANNCCWTRVTDLTLWTLENLRFTEAIGSGLTTNTVPNYYWQVKNCVFDSCGGAGWYGVDDFAYCIGTDLVSFDNGGPGYDYIGNHSRLINVLALNNTLEGIDRCHSDSVMINPVCIGNGDAGIRTEREGITIWNPTIDGNGDAGIYTGNNDFAVFVGGGRITNNVGWGMEGYSGGGATALNSSLVDYRNVFHNNSSGDMRNGEVSGNLISGDLSYGDAANHISDPPNDGYTKRVILITYDGGTNMTNASIGDTVTDGTWSGTVLTVPTGDVTGTFEADAFDGGNPADDDAITIGGVETADVNGTPTIVLSGDNNSNYAVSPGALLSSRNAADEVALNWHDLTEGTISVWVTAGLPIEAPAGRKGVILGRLH